MSPTKCVCVRPEAVALAAAAETIIDEVAAVKLRLRHVGDAANTRWKQSEQLLASVGVIELSVEDVASLPFSKTELVHNVGRQSGYPGSGIHPRKPDHFGVVAIRPQRAVGVVPHMFTAERE